MKFYPLAFNLLFIFFISVSGISVQAQVQFIENKGQWNKQVKFMSNAGDGAFYLTENGFTISQFDGKALVNIKDRAHGIQTGNSKSESNSKSNNNSSKVKSHAYTVSFLNGNAANITGEKPLVTVNNYFIGNDPSKWASNCRIFQAVTYHEVYPNIDVRYYVDGGSNLKYDIIVKPGGRVEDIAMKYNGVDKIETKNNELVITTPLGKSKELKPYTFQTLNNARQEVNARYEVKGDVVKFKVKNYSPQETLIIDPTEIFFSYSGSTADNWGFTATYGPDGSFYGGGIVFGQGFPVSPGSYDQNFESDRDIGIIKLSPDGSQRIYATYIGGNNEEQPHSLVVDAQGNLVLAGRTNSSDYPCVPARNPLISGVGGGWDICVTKLNASGSALIGSMRIGGPGDDGVNIVDDNSGNGLNSLKRNYGDDARSEVILDGLNNIYVASSSSSPSSSFPTTPGVIQRNNAGMQDAVVLKLSPNCDNVLLSTLLGGSANDAAYVLTLGQNGNIYVAGGTASPDLKGISASGVIKPAYSPAAAGDECDGYVIELNNTFSSAINGTYIGTTSPDQVYGIETDKNGFIYVMGTSEGNMPVINAAYSVPGSKQFISKLAPDLSVYIYSTVFGSPNSGVPNISPTAFLVDRCENVYVSGWGGKPNAGYRGGNTIGMPVTAGAIKSQTDASGSDFYFFVLQKDAASQLYGSFFGQEDPVGPITFGDHVDGGTSRFDRNGVIYQALCANCGRTEPFPGTPGSWSPTNQAQTNGKCNLGMLKIEMNFTGVRAGLRTLIDGVPNDTSGCAPLTVNFNDTLKLGKLYYWNFGDGSGDTTTSPTNSHVYNSIGNYLVRLIAIDSLTCNISDTSYRTIRVGNKKIILNFLPAKIPPCTNLSYQFTNISTAGLPFNQNTFTWDFGDNTPLLTTNFAPPVSHTYAGPGTYQVKLSVSDTSFCNSPADTIKTVRLSPQVKALFVTPDRGCAPYNAVFINNSLGGLNFQWTFGDGSSSTASDPTHLYSTPGVYQVKLVAFDSTSCNKIDVANFTIKVSPKPTASFIFSPINPVENQATMFVNQSSGATTYLWNFGDGDTSIQVNPSHIFNATNTYRVCLNASNDAGCSADTCKPVRSLIRPLLDVPSAFTPGRFGQNGVISVVGFGIKDMIWSIYNRWGQKVYESNNTKIGWDGTFKGKLQPMDVYAYTLKVTFSDGSKTVKTGDITLLR
ncbi:MAG: PKD domain-containing protein [Ginsengibacter sp.]